MKTRNSIGSINVGVKFAITLFAFGGLSGSLFSSSAAADFVILSRYSEVQLESTNFGGVEQSASTTSVDLPFQIQLADAIEHIEAGGNINGGLWDVSQDSMVTPELIRAQLHSETLTQQIFGNGIGILNANNVFEIEFEVTEETQVELGGTYFGTSDNLFASDFVRIQFQIHNGVTFLNLFQTTMNQQLDIPFQSTLVPGNLYRISVVSEAYSIGAETHSSGATVCLRSKLLVGDVNQDDTVDLLDIGPFVETISNGTYSVAADINCDGLVNLLDVDDFVQLLAGN
ncbi:MAG: hypothetical protein AAGA30_10475 [Planctomycetota bacterium]